MGMALMISMNILRSMIWTGLSQSREIRTLKDDERQNVDLNNEDILLLAKVNLKDADRFTKLYV